MAGYLLLFSILLLIILLLFNNRAEVRVPNIIAGDADTIVTVDASSIRSNFIYFLDKQVFLRPKSVFIGKLIGNSMDTRGLYCEDIVMGRNIKTPLTEKFNPGDLLIIKISDNSRLGYGKLKIREFKEDLEDGKIQTIKYENDLPINSAPHSKKDVIAVVDRIVKSNRALRRVMA
jgi:hypothetical protein